jgi:hypothetical protein
MSQWLLFACHYPHLFSSAPEAQRKLAGGEAAGMPVIIASAPRQGRWTRSQEMDIYYYDSSSSAPAGAQYDVGRLPVAKPPANFHRPFRANKRNA